MSIVGEVALGIDEVLDAVWNIREGQVVPKTEDVVLRNGAVKVDATYVYADLADSSGAAQRLKIEVAAKVVRAFLNASCKILRHFGGEIRSFDGDRVMAIFIGGSKNTQAVKAALAINWAVTQVMRPEVNRRWTDLVNIWQPAQGVGIATGEAMLVRGGVRNNSDLISIGEAPNVAAKLSEMREGPDTYVTDAVHGVLNESASEYEGQNMWRRASTQNIGGKSFRVMGSSWWLTP